MLMITLEAIMKWFNGWETQKKMDIRLKYNEELSLVDTELVFQNGEQPLGKFQSKQNTTS
jgi:hypothetical protein